MKSLSNSYLHNLSHRPLPSLLFKMPCATVTSLTEDEIDDLLYYARTGQLDDFRASIEAFARTSNTSHYEVVRAAVDHQSGNSPLHMASANGHSSK